VFLDPNDVAALRPDLGDLRIIDAAGKQVPYLLDARPIPRWIAADVEETPASERGWQALWIRPRQVDGAIPIEAARLEVAETAFARGFRLFALDERGRETPAGSGRLQAAPDGSAIEIAVAAGGRLRALRLSIDNGDNAPLGLRAADVRTSVRRVVYNGTGGAATMLLGNPRARAPRYDVASIAPDLVSARARTVNPADRVAGSAFAPTVEAAAARGVDRVALWAILGLSVAALLGLTVRLLRDQSR
jgi:hypothetical protein